MLASHLLPKHPLKFQPCWLEYGYLPRKPSFRAMSLSPHKLSKPANHRHMHLPWFPIFHIHGLCIYSMPWRCLGFPDILDAHWESIVAKLAKKRSNFDNFVVGDHSYYNHSSGNVNGEGFERHLANIFLRAMIALASARRGRQMPSQAEPSRAKLTQHRH